jgi:NADP-dependent 3-hydroxy acid dehydrogenase YdfG
MFCGLSRRAGEDGGSGGGSVRGPSAKFVKELYDKIGIPADSVARAILYAIEQPAEAEIDEAVLRPTAQDS